MTNDQEAEKKPQYACEHVQAVCSELFKKGPWRGAEHTSLSLRERCVQTHDPQSTNGKAKTTRAAPGRRLLKDQNKHDDLPSHGGEVFQNCTGPDVMICLGRIPRWENAT
jgi:hypothetical protein